MKSQEEKPEFMKPQEELLINLVNLSKQILTLLKIRDDLQCHAHIHYKVFPKLNHCVSSKWVLLPVYKHKMVFVSHYWILTETSQNQ